MTKTPNPGGLPRGAGSMQMRRRCWWLIFTDAGGRVVQENSGTDDPAKARHILTERAIAVCETRLRMLRDLLNEQGKRRKAAAHARGRGDNPRNRRAPQGAPEAAEIGHLLLVRLFQLAPTAWGLDRERSAAPRI